MAFDWSILVKVPWNFILNLLCKLCPKNSELAKYRQTIFNEMYLKNGIEIIIEWLFVADLCNNDNLSKPMRTLPCIGTVEGLLNINLEQRINKIHNELEKKNYSIDIEGTNSINDMIKSLCDEINFYKQKILTCKIPNDRDIKKWKKEYDKMKERKSYE